MKWSSLFVTTARPWTSAEAFIDPQSGWKAEQARELGVEDLLGQLLG